MKGLDVFSVNRLKGEVSVFIGKFLQVSYFRNTFFVKIQNLEEGFLRSFFSNFVLSGIRN